MASTLVYNGQSWILDRLLAYINTSGLYIGLMEEQTNILETAQIGQGITEIDPTGDLTGSGYSRQLSTGWTKTSTSPDPYITGPATTFNVSGTWTAVNGYFVSTTLDGTDVLWAEQFPMNKFGDKTAGDRIIIIPKYEQRDQLEP